LTSLPSFDLTGRAALVTGAARGLGRAIALALAEAGADVALGVREPRADADDLVAEIERVGRKAFVLQLDISDRSQIASGVEEAAARHGKLDILVNNEGIAPGKQAEAVTEAHFDATLNVNLGGTFFTSQHAARIMLRQGFGRIINVSSQAGFVALPGESVYCMTKAAINHLTRCLAVEWGQRGVNVNAIAPTFIETPGTDTALSDPDFREDVETRIAALHRIGQPNDVTGAVVFLASPAADLITGHTMLIDGGWTAR
jgi:NAD(P)-dependent dehydrogenase (short-subunit alcohol dehydrogenase family)